MAFKLSDLSVLAYANGFTLWHYRTGDGAAQVDNAGYFDEAAEMLRAGDMIMANTGASGGLLRVDSNAAGTVDVANLTVVGETDSD
jgi:hypothetical protein